MWSVYGFGNGGSHKQVIRFVPHFSSGVEFKPCSVIFSRLTAEFTFVRYFVSAGSGDGRYFATIGWATRLTFWVGCFGLLVYAYNDSHVCRNHPTHNCELVILSGTQSQPRDRSHWCSWDFMSVGSAINSFCTIFLDRLCRPISVLLSVSVISTCAAKESLPLWKPQQMNRLSCCSIALVGMTIWRQTAITMDGRSGRCLNYVHKIGHQRYWMLHI